MPIGERFHINSAPALVMTHTSQMMLLVVASCFLCAWTAHVGDSAHVVAKNPDEGENGGSCKGASGADQLEDEIAKLAKVGDADEALGPDAADIDPMEKQADADGAAQAEQDEIEALKKQVQLSKGKKSESRELRDAKKSATSAVTDAKKAGEAKQKADSLQEKAEALAPYLKSLKAEAKKASNKFNELNDKAQDASTVIAPLEKEASTAATENEQQLNKVWEAFEKAHEEARNEVSQNLKLLQDVRKTDSLKEENIDPEPSDKYRKVKNATEESMLRAASIRQEAKKVGAELRGIMGLDTTTREPDLDPGRVADELAGGDNNVADIMGNAPIRAPGGAACNGR